MLSVGVTSYYIRLNLKQDKSRMKKGQETLHICWGEKMEETRLGLSTVLSFTSTVYRTSYMSSTVYCTVYLS